MQVIFNSCFTDCYEDAPVQLIRSDVSIKVPQPIKFKLVKSLNLLNPILKNFALPRRKEKYTFPRKNLYYLQTDKNCIPFVYASVPNPSQSILIIYCHGSGSTLNHVYQYSMSMAWKFNVAVIAYDYTGDGQSRKQFFDFQSDLRCVMSWAIKQGYDLRRIILCGFSLGSYSALCLKGQMARILISPLCGITSYVEDKAIRFEGQIFDNLGKALDIKSRVWITHCSKQLIPIEHARKIEQVLLKNNKRDQIQFTQIKEGYDHKSAPGFLFSQQGSKKLQTLISKVLKQSKQLGLNQDSKKLKTQLIQLSKQITVRSQLQEGSKNA